MPKLTEYITESDRRKARERKSIAWLKQQGFIPKETTRAKMDRYFEKAKEKAPIYYKKFNRGVVKVQHGARRVQQEARRVQRKAREVSREHYGGGLDLGGNFGGGNLNLDFPGLGDEMTRKKKKRSLSDEVDTGGLM